MIYVRATFAGLATIVTAFVVVLIVLARRAHGAQIGFSPSIFLAPGVLLPIVALFALGFGVALALLKR